jgi:lactoylglutathione lyase
MKIILFILALFTIQTVNTFAQNSNEAIQVQINHIAIAVTELEESEHFYREIIGLKQIPEPFGLGMHAWFDIGGAQLHIISAAEERSKHDIHNHLCFSVSDMDSFIERITSHGIEFFDWNQNPGEITVRVDGVQQIYFTDPDGYWIEVNDDV